VVSVHVVRGVGGGMSPFLRCSGGSRDLKAMGSFGQSVYVGITLTFVVGVGVLLVLPRLLLDLSGLF
jgi:hypothetical protein